MLAPALEDRSPSAEQTAIVYSAIAIGSHLRDLEMGRKEDSSSAFFRRSLNNLSEVFMAKDSLRKLQVRSPLQLFLLITPDNAIKLTYIPY